MVSVDISLAPSLLLWTLPVTTLCHSHEKPEQARFGSFGGHSVFSERIRLRQKEGVTRISESKRSRFSSPSSLSTEIGVSELVLELRLFSALAYIFEFCRSEFYEPKRGRARTHTHSNVPNAGVVVPAQPPSAHATHHKHNTSAHLIAIHRSGDALQVLCPR